MACAKCNQDLTNEKEVAKCCDCDLEFHLTCCRVKTIKVWSKMTVKKRNEWRCDGCNSDTASLPGRSDNEDSGVVLEILRQIQRDMASDRNTSKEGFRGLESSMKSVNDKLEEMTNKLVKVETENAQLKEECVDLQKKNEDLSRKVWSLQADMWDIQQYSRCNNLEIMGVPSTDKEDIYFVLENMAGKLGLQYNRGDVSVAHRLPPPRRRGAHRSIIVQFVSRTTRAAWLIAAKQKKLQTTDLSTSLEPGPVFVNEHLTVHNKMLLGRGRRVVREKRLAGAWSRDGKIMVRRTPSSEPIRVWTMEDIEREALRPVNTSRGADSEPCHTPPH